MKKIFGIAGILFACTVFFAFSSIIRPSSTHPKIRKSAHLIDSCKCRVFLFVIYPQHRSRKIDVESTSNWICMGEYDNHRSKTCTPGNSQACNLLVDERDTEQTERPGYPKLKKEVLIAAKANPRESSLFYVIDYKPTGSYLYRIINE
jgi:hypothetical protein